MTDAMVSVDGPLVDMSASDTIVDAPPSPRVVAHYLFHDVLTDSENEHDATNVGAELSYVNGRNGETDHALRFPTNLSSHARIPDSPAFDLPKGEIELWFRYDNSVPEGDLGIISRDANGSETNGHFNVRLGHDQRLVMRIQKLSNPTIEAYRCTAATISLNVWHHVVITFGGTLTMQVDGVLAAGTTWTDQSAVVRDCTVAWTTGIDGNDNPWILGALSVTSTEGSGTPVVAVAGGVQIDELLIRSLP